MLIFENDELMKYGKLLKGLLTQRSNANAQVAVAVVAGLAAGAVLSILFAPASGKETRGRIADGAKGIGNGIKDRYTSLKDRVVGMREIEEIEEFVPQEVPHFNHERPKKRKSDIKDLIHESHSGGEGEQSFS